ncbi:alginate lyase family protein [Paraburkholderia madseniana]|uniref:alginate lyase family protein n=1 Tax=Paraburkholderia madseniana TaxID=2599607 RepID=UPI000BCD18AB|nr:alginate lyase family protein [Paraburkholderia madseniana]NPT69127.1 cell wall anchor protein [Paraburkholderia madseniana]SOE74931.1 Alginate lyase [Burkholderia sp. OK233]
MLPGEPVPFGATLKSSNLIRQRSACVARFSCGILAALLLVSTDPEALANDAHPFVHPGLLHTRQDFDRMRIKVAHGDQPWFAGWQKLIANRHASLNWKPNPQVIVYRGADGHHVENYAALFNDAAAAYALALRWKISGDDAYAGKAVEILNAWSSTLTAIDGTSDRFLASGIYGYQLANAAEILRTYPEWRPADFHRFQTMMLAVFYPMNHDFLVRHNGAETDHYWANWDLANMDSMLAIGVLTDRRDIYDEATGYFRHGAGNGSIGHVVWKVYDGGIGQLQESGRDQGHTMLDVALLGTFCQMAWNQGDDLFGYDHNRFLLGAEYAARYNLGLDVPYTAYSNSDVTQTTISNKSRGDVRPIWELLYNHYVVLKGMSAPDVEAFARKVRVEGGGGDYGSNSGGFDQLGYGTLTFTLK